MSMTLAGVLADIAADLPDNSTGLITPAVLRSILGEVATFASQQAATGPALSAVLFQIGQLYGQSTLLTVIETVPVEPENQVRLWFDHYPWVTSGGVLDVWFQAQNFGVSINWGSVYGAAYAMNPV